MKKLKLTIILIVLILLIAKVYEHFATRYLYLEYYKFENGKMQAVEITKVEFYGIAIDENKSSLPKDEIIKTTITDKRKIHIFVNYLRNIPLRYAMKKKDINNCEGCSVYFYSDDMMEGSIEITTDNFIYSGLNCKTYTVKDKGRNVISEIKNIGLGDV